MADAAALDAEDVAMCMRPLTRAHPIGARSGAMDTAHRVPNRRADRCILQCTEGKRDQAHRKKKKKQDA
jgi:hypothetical protein